MPNEITVVRGVNAAIVCVYQTIHDPHGMVAVESIYTIAQISAYRSYSPPLAVYVRFGNELVPARLAIHRGDEATLVEVLRIAGSNDVPVAAARITAA